VVGTQDKVSFSKPERPQSYRLRRTFQNIPSHVCGADIYVDTTMPPFELAQKLQAMTEQGPFKLTLISNRGTQVWPSGSVYTEIVDYYRVRFELKDPNMLGKIGQAPSVHLLTKVCEVFNITDFQPLRMYDGKPGFSLAQGQ
jgi:isocitrate dehydrogenase